MKNLVDFLNKQNIEFEENVDGKKLCSFKVGGNVRVVVIYASIMVLAGIAWLIIRRVKKISMITCYDALYGQNSKILLDQPEKKNSKKNKKAKKQTEIKTEAEIQNNLI